MLTLWPRLTMYAMGTEVFPIAEEISQNICNQCDTQVCHNQITEKGLLSLKEGFL